MFVDGGSVVSRVDALEQHRATARIVPSDDVERSLLSRYIEAWDAVDIPRLAGLLTSDVILTMPPVPVRYTGREAVAEFFATVPSGGALDRLRLLGIKVSDSC